MRISGRFDSHAHVFARHLPMLKTRRYTPAKSAYPPAYRALLKAEKIDGALLVQPSFLGTDNDYLLNALQTARAGNIALKMWGVAVISPRTSQHEIAKMSVAGVVGARINLIGQKTPDFRSATWQNFLRRIDDAGWHLEIHAEGPRIAEFLGAVSMRCQRIVLDHFALPCPGAPLACNGMRTILKTPRDRLWVKLSGPYRAFPNLHPDTAAAKCDEIVHALREHLGTHRLLWGSDWPWTQHEQSGITYAHTLEWRRRWLGNDQDGFSDLLAK